MNELKYKIAIYMNWYLYLETLIFPIDDAILLNGDVLTLRKESMNDPLSIKDEHKRHHYNKVL